MLPTEKRQDVLQQGLHAVWVVENFLAYGGKDYPKRIDFETYSACNRSCDYCPRVEDDILMPMETVKKTIDELSDWGFKGSIGHHSFNEPLLDKRLDDIIKYTHQKLPNTFINVFTNGDFLNEERLLRLQDASVQEIIVTLHDPANSRAVARIQDLKAKYNGYLKLKDLRAGSRDEPLSNRGGQVEIGETTYLKRCSRVNTMVIRADGNVVLCCNDGYKKHIMGNINTRNVQDIWTDKEFSALRKDIRIGVFNLEMCLECGYQTKIDS